MITFQLKQMSSLLVDLDVESGEHLKDLASLAYISLIVFQLTPDKRFHQKIQSICAYLDFFNINPTVKTIIRLKNIEEYSGKTYKSVAVGGTFDHLHLGHQVLLLDTILSATEEIFIGVTGQPMLAAKKNKDVIEPLSIRMKNVEQFVTSIKGDLKIHVFQLQDGYGQAIVVDRLEALVVSEETIKGGVKINQIRKSKEMSSLEIIICQTIAPKSLNQFKLSSTVIREELLKKNNMNSEMCREYWSFWDALIAKMVQQYFGGIKDSQKQKISERWKWYIFHKYSEYWRFYHTNYHIFSLLKRWHGDQFKQRRQQLTVSDRITIEIAIFFHDVIYQIDSSSNQEDSAVQSNRFLDELFGESQGKQILKQTVSLLILETKAHCPSTKLSQILYDLDMGILNDQQNYKAYAKGIRLEFEPLVKDKYPLKRRQFLTNLLKSQTYFSFQATHLQSNVEWEIKSLQANDL